MRAATARQSSFVRAPLEMVETAGKQPAAATVTVAEALDTGATDGQTAVAAGCRRRRRSSDRPRSVVVLSAVAVVVLATATAVDWARTADVCRHWIVTAAELLSAADQKVNYQNIIVVHLHRRRPGNAPAVRSNILPSPGLCRGISKINMFLVFGILFFFLRSTILYRRVWLM